MKGFSNIYLIITGASILFVSILFLYKLDREPITISDIPSLGQSSLDLTPSQGVLRGSQTFPFSDETFVTGISHRHTQKKEKLTSFEDTLGAGVCVADFNSDGWDDIFFVAGSGNRRHFGKENWWKDKTQNQLYINYFGKYFINTSLTSGIDEIGFGIACAASDLNNDGNIDIIIANKGANRVYQNTGKGKFQLVEHSFNEDPEYFTTSILVKDFNQDGMNDLLFGNYVSYTQDQNVLELNAGFANHNKINFDPALYDAQPDTLFMNNGDFSFSRSSAYTSENKHGRTLGFYADDSVTALNDRGSPTQIVYSVQHESERKDITVNARDAKTIRAPKKAAEKLFLASDASNGGIFAITLTGRGNEKSWDYRINKENRLHANTWAILTADFDRDGQKDIFLSNGSMLPHPDSPKTTVGQPNTLLIANLNNRNFDSYILPNERVLSSRGAAIIDMNNDGKLDVILSNNNDYPSLLINKANIHSKWIGLRCLPTYLCKNVTVEINSKKINEPFKLKNNFASQSSSLFLHVLEEEPVQSLQVKSQHSSLKFSIDKTDTYYLLDLEHNSIAEIHSPPETHSSDHIMDREELIALLKIDEIGENHSSLVATLTETSLANKIIIVSTVVKTANRNAFPLVDHWAKSDDLSLALGSIEALKVLAIEESIPTLIYLINSPSTEISCAAINAFQFFFWKDEAVIERKYWAQSALVKVLNSDNPEKIICAIDALAESESFRAMAPLIKLLGSDNVLIASRSAKALGMLRQTSAIPNLLHALRSHTSPLVKSEALVALVQLNADLRMITENEILIEGDPLYNATFSHALRISGYGMNTNKLIARIMSRETPANFQILSKLNFSELFVAYSFLKSFSAEGSYEKLLFNHLNKSFNNPGRIAELFKSLSISDQRKVVNNLSLPTLKAFVKSTPLALHTLCPAETEAKPHDICQSLNGIDNLSVPAIAETIKMQLNSGQYDYAAITGIYLRESSDYAIALNQLIVDKSLQKHEKLFLLSNLPLNEQNLASISVNLNNFSDGDILKILRNMEQQYEARTYKSWIANFSSTTSSLAIKSYAKGLTGTPRNIN